MMRTDLKFAILIIAATVMFNVVVFGRAADKIQYQLKLEPNEIYYFQTVTDQQISQKIEGRDQNVKNSITYGFDFKVDEIESGGNFWLNCKYRLIKFSLQDPRGKDQYDSTQRHKPVSVAAAGFAAMVDEDFYANVTPQGRFERINGLATVRRYMASKIPDIAQKKQIVAGLKNQINEDSMRAFFEDYLAIYPDKPVGKGDSWTRTEANPKDAPGIYKKTWTLKQRRDGKAIIDYSAVIEPNPDAKRFGRRRIITMQQLSGRESGQLEIDETTGLIVSSKITSEITSETKVLKGAELLQQPPQSAKVQATIIYEMVKGGYDQLNKKQAASDPK